MGRTANSDPLEKFRFLIEFTLPGSITPVRTGFHDVQMPKRSTNKIAYREGHDPTTNTQSAGLSTFEDIVLSRGVIARTPGNTASDDLYTWIKSVHLPSTGIVGYSTQSSIVVQPGYNDYRGDVTIKMLDRAGVPARAWKIYQAWPTNFVPGSDLNAAEDGDKSLESITLCYEDFQEVSITDFNTAL
jgi:phage tail-like protein